MLNKIFLLAVFCVILSACGDQNPPPPAQQQGASKPITEEEIGRPDLTPPEKKSCAIMGFLCK